MKEINSGLPLLICDNLSSFGFCTKTAQNISPICVKCFWYSLVKLQVKFENQGNLHMFSIYNECWIFSGVFVQ